MIVSRWALAAAGMLGVLSALLIGAAQAAGATWMRDGELAFASYSDINPDIFIVDVDHDLPLNLTHSPAYDVDPAWSPDGNWLAFVSDRDGRRNIYVMDALGENLRRLTNDRGFYSNPRWSVDGQRLVFTANNEAPDTLYSINVDGSGLQRLTDPEHPGNNIVVDLGIEPGNVSQARSPDGSRIAFMTYRDQGWGIYISRDASRFNAHLLVNVGVFTEAPAWSSDGKKMAYIARRDGFVDLFTVGVDDGSAPRRLTFNRAIDTSPVWRP